MVKPDKYTPQVGRTSWLIKRTERAAYATIADALRDLGLTPSQYAVLQALVRLEGRVVRGARLRLLRDAPGDDRPGQRPGAAGLHQPQAARVVTGDRGDRDRPRRARVRGRDRAGLGLRHPAHELASAPPRSRCSRTRSSAASTRSKRGCRSPRTPRTRTPKCSARPTPPADRARRRRGAHLSSGFVRQAIVNSLT